MKKFIKIFVLFILLASVLFGVKVLADTVFIANPLESQDIAGLVGKVTTFLIEVFLPIAIIMVLYAAFTFITAGGDETKVKQAKQVLTWAVVGVAVLLVAKSVVTIIKDFIPGAPQSVADIVQIFCNFSWWFLELVFAIAILAILWAAFRYITAGGDEKNVASAKQILIYAIIGIAIALVAFSVIDLVYSFMPGGTGSLGICAAPGGGGPPPTGEKSPHGSSCQADTDCVQGNEPGCTDTETAGGCAHVCESNICVGATGDGCVPGSPTFGLCSSSLGLTCKADPSNVDRCLP